MSILTKLHDGRTFPSISAAARAIGVDHKTITYHLDTHGHTARVKSQCKPVELDGIEYPSIAAAANALGISRGMVNHRRGYRKP